MSLPLLPRGGNTTLQPALAQGPRVSVVVNWSGEPPKQHSVDIAAILVDAEGKAVPGGLLAHGNSHESIEISDIVVSGEDRYQTVTFSTDTIPENVQRIALTLVVQVAGHVRNIKSLSNIAATVKDINDTPVCRSEFATQGMETAMVLADVYRRNGEWKFKSIGQGFQGGMRALAESFGLTAADAAMGQETHIGQKGSVTANTRPEDITTFRPGKTGGIGEVKMHLTWAAAVPTPVTLVPKAGLGRLLGIKPGTPQNLDLDLCCLFELSDGHRGVVQALGDKFGAYKMAPYLQLMGDERQSANETGEVLRLNGDRLNELHRVIVYAMIFEGPANWAAASPKLAVRVGEEMPLNIRPATENKRGRVMALAYLEIKDGALVLHKLSENYASPRELDEAYEWGLRWTAGRKD